MEVEIRYVTADDAVEELEKIFSALQNNDETNDKWDWMGADFYLHVIKSHLADEKKKLP